MAALSLRFSWRRHVQPFFSFPPPLLLLLQQQQQQLTHPSFPSQQQQQQQRLRRLRTSALPPPHHHHHHHQVLLYDNNHHTIFMNIASSSSSSSFSPSPQDFVFLSVGLLLMYWVSNFVVPDLLMKNLFEEEEEKKEEEVKQPVDVERNVFYEGLTGGGEGSNPDLAAGILNSNTKVGKSVNTGFGKDSKKEQKGRKRTKSNAPPN